MTAKLHASDAELDDERIAQAVEDFFTACDQGEPPELNAFLAKYADIADVLNSVIRALCVTDDRSGESRQHLVGRNSRVGDFRVIRQIGRGGMGVVYEAEQISMSRRVALKILPFAGLTDEKTIRRFQSEVRASAILDHPHIVAAYTVGEERGIHYYAMQLINGKNLAQLIASLREIDDCVDLNADSILSAFSGLSVADGVISGERKVSHDSDTAAGDKDDDVTLSPHLSDVSKNPLSNQTQDELFRSAAALGVQAALALQHAHEHGVVHRDIKPSNLLLDEQAKLYVADFGLAQIEAGENLTLTGNVLGTIRYMPPEQARGNAKVVDQRADIYSLAATLYELITLRPVFSHNDTQQLLKAIEHDEPTPLRRIDRRIPVDLETIVLKSLAKEPKERYQTARDMADDLRAFLDHRPISARRPDLRQRIAKWTRRNTALTWTFIAFLLVVSFTLGISSFVVTSNSRKLRRLSNDLELARAFSTFSKGDLVQAEKFLDQIEDRSQLEYTVLSTVCRRLHGEQVAGAEGVWCLSADRSALATYDNRKVVITRIGDGDHSAVVTIPFDPQPQFMALNGDLGRLLIGCRDGLWFADVNQKTVARVSVAGSGFGRFSPDGRLAAVITNDHRLQIWDVTAKKLASQKKIYPDALDSNQSRCSPVGVLFASNSEIVTVCRREAEGIKVWASDGRDITSVDDDCYESSDLFNTCMYDRDTLLVVGYGGLRVVPLNLFDVGSELSVNLPKIEPSPSLALSPDGGRVAVIVGRAIEVYDLSSGYRTFHRFSEGFGTKIEFVGNDKVVVKNHGHVELFSLDQDYFEKLPIKADLNWPCTACFSRSQVVLPGGIDNVLSWGVEENSCWDLPLRAAEGNKLGRARCVRLSPSGDKLATVHDDAPTTVRIWACGSGELLQETLFENDVYALDFLREDEIAVGCDGTLAIVDTETGRVRWKQNTQDGILRLAVSANGEVLAAGTSHGRISIWKLDRAEPRFVREFTLEHNVLAVSVSPDACWVVGGDCFGNLSGVAVDDSFEGFQLSGHKMAICQIAFSPDGTTMVTGGDDRCINFWRVGPWRNTGELVLNDNVKSVGFVENSSGGWTFVVGTGSIEPYQVHVLHEQPDE